MHIPPPPILFIGIAILVPDQVYTWERCKSLHVNNTMYVEMQRLVSKERHLARPEVCKSHQGQGRSGHDVANHTPPNPPLKMQGTRPCNWRATRGLFQARGSRQASQARLVFLGSSGEKGEWAEIRPVVFTRPCRCQKPGKGGACAAAFLGDFGLRRCAVEASCNFFVSLNGICPLNRSLLACTA